MTKEESVLAKVDRWRIDAEHSLKVKAFIEVVGREPDAIERGMLMDAVLTELDREPAQHSKINGG